MHVWVKLCLYVGTNFMVSEYLLAIYYQYGLLYDIENIKEIKFRLNPYTMENKRKKFIRFLVSMNTMKIYEKKSLTQIVPKLFFGIFNIAYCKIV